MNRIRNLGYKIGMGLATLTIIGGTVLASGCTPNPEYHFDGNIGEDHVRFYEKDLYHANILEVIRPNGTMIKYLDYFLNDFKIDSIEITKDGVTSEYVNDPAGKAVLEEGQSQFDSYLKQIVEIKKAKGLNDLK